MPIMVIRELLRRRRERKDLGELEQFAQRQLGIPAVDWQELAAFFRFIQALGGVPADLGDRTWLEQIVLRRQTKSQTASIAAARERILETTGLVRALSERHKGQKELIESIQEFRRTWEAAVRQGGDSPGRSEAAEIERLAKEWQEVAGQIENPIAKTAINDLYRALIRAAQERAGRRLGL